MRIAYLDNSATTPVCREAAEKVVEMMTVKYGNPSSLHTMGLEAEREISQARERIASLLHCQAEEITFTSGGTEANNLALLGAVQARRRMGNRIVVSAVEHASVLAAAREAEKAGFEVVLLQPDGAGVIPEQAVLEAVNQNTVFVSMQLINNEVGAIQPVEVLARAVKRAKAPALVHIDAVQALGKREINPKKWGADLLTVSAHKIHGPKGAGALYHAKGVRLLPRAFGGEQERKLRPGTEAAPLIAGFGAAAAALPPWRQAEEQVRALRDECAARLGALPGVVVNSAAAASPYILNISVEGIRSETMLHHLASHGVYVSSGSACSKGKKSHVLSAMGLPAGRIDSALRISFSTWNTREDVAQLAETLESGIRTLARAREA